MRWLAGVFDPRGNAEWPRLRRSLEPATTTILERGPLQVACTGPEPSSLEPLCLLDGFLYNARELEAALGDPRCPESEDLLALGYRRWGSDLLPRLRGDFALLIWDGDRQEGLLARDQIGVRSLFLHESSGALVFASEVCQLLALLPRRPGPDPVGVAHWLAISGRPGDGTMHEGVRRLAPATTLVLGPDGVRERRYWQPRYREPLDLPSPELAGELRGAIAKAVRRRFDGDGRAGVMMSGGLDSSAVAAVAADLAPEGRISAYSAVFPDHPRVDEAELIARLRDALGLSGTTARVYAGGLLASALDWSARWSVPLVGWGEFWASSLSAAAAGSGVRVMLDGEGGDQLFGRRVYLLADLVRSGRLGEAVRVARELQWTARSPPRRRELVRPLWELGVLGALPAVLEDVVRSRRPDQRAPGWLLPETARLLHGSHGESQWKHLNGPRWWAHSAYALTAVVEQFGLFEHYRRRAAAAGLESRHPLFDLDLLELGLRQPPLATVDRLDRPLLRAAMAGLVPDAVRLRPGKALFDSLLIDTLAGPDRPAIERLLSRRDAELGAFVDLQRMRVSLLSAGDSEGEGSFLWMYRLWRLVALECWLRLEAGAGGEDLAAELGVSRARVEL